MEFTPASGASVAAFLAVVVVVLGCLLAGAYVAARRGGANEAAAARATLRMGLGVGAYLAITSGAVASGVLGSQPFPGIPLAFAAINASALLFGFSAPAGELARNLPLSALVAFQGFRLPLELVLHSWAAQGTVPETMTWTGSNFDIASGVAALALAPVAGRQRIAAWAANGLGMVLLLNVARVAMMSSPLPFAWGVRPPLLLLLHLPYALIATVCVAGAVAGHAILARRLLAKPD
jgi:hypothetical protein